MSTEKYNAFISYRHHPADTACAKAVQQGLEHFVIPKAIRENYHINKIEKVFRDEEDLEITSDLSEKIETALHHSDYLIVICSPRYKESKWCLLEIESFLKDHDQDHVLCVLCEGEPPEIFPERLLRKTVTVLNEDGTETTAETPCEPLATDFRKDRKTVNRVELPRLAAALIGCGYDELIMRQERYRRKRMYSLLSLIFSLSAIALSYLLWSNMQIRKNYRQSLINASKVSAAESLDCYSSQDRYKALSLSLEALPSPELDRPVIDQAEYALSLASYAYQTPYRYLEKWRIDSPNDITSYFVSRDQKYIVYLDRTGLFTAVDLNTHETVSSFKVSEQTIPAGGEEGKDGELITYADGKIISADYLSGEINWSIGLKYQQLGKTSVSHSGEYIAAADSYAVQMTDAEGNPYLSMPLPADTEGYISDLCWSPDDQRIAVKLRIPGGGYRMGVYDVSTSEFTLSDHQYEEIPYFTYHDGNILYYIGDSNVSHSFAFENNTKELYRNTYELCAVKENESLFSTPLDDSSVIGKIEITEYRDQLILAMGNTLTLLNRDGSYADRFILPSSVESFQPAGSDAFEVIMTDGYSGLYEPQSGNLKTSRVFPSECEDIAFYPGTGFRDTRYIVMKDSNLMFYENVSDENLSLFEGTPMPDMPISFLQGDDLLAFRNENTITLADTKSRQITAKVTIPLDYAFHMLTIEDDLLWILKIDSSDGTLRAEGYDRDGKQCREYDLSSKDFLTSSSLVSSPLTLQDTVFLDTWYNAPSSLAVQNGVIYLHDYENPNTIEILDLHTGEDRTVKVDVPGYSTISRDAFTQPSVLRVSEDGKMLFTVVSDAESAMDAGSLKAVLLNIETGEQIIPEGVPDHSGIALIKNEQFIYSGENEIFVYDKKGSLSYTIPYTSQKAVSMDLFDGKLFVLYPDSVLSVYEKGKEIRSVNLEFNEPYLYTRDIHYQYAKDILYVFSYNNLRAVSLASDAETPLYAIDESAFAYLEDTNEILVVSRIPDQFIKTYLPGTFRQYASEELIERGAVQFAAYCP